MRREIVASLVGMGIAGGVLAAPPFPTTAEGVMAYAAKENETVGDGNYTVSEAIRNLHETLTIVDLHADTLLWGWPLIDAGGRGHADHHRLAEGNVALQVFSVVTRVPTVLAPEGNVPGEFDRIGRAARLLGWPEPTWTKLMPRALYQAERLVAAAARDPDKLAVIRTRRDLDALLDARKTNRRKVGGLLAIEGAQALDGTPENVDVLFEAGFRMMSPAHYYDTEMSGSAHGIDRGGLTPKGRQMLERMFAKGMIVDVSHASPKALREILDLNRPVVASHTGVRSHCDKPRNLTDDEVRSIAARRGLIAIAYFTGAVCGQGTVKDVGEAIVKAADLAGYDRVALGSDFDGGVDLHFDARGLPLITRELRRLGVSDADIARVMGGNAITFLRANLPE